MSTARRPLIVRIRNWVGDVVLGVPVLRLLEAHGYALHIVARGRWAPALLSGYRWPVTVQESGLREKISQLRALRHECSAVDPGFERRDNALLLPVSLSSALEVRLAGLRAVGVAKEGRSPLLARALPWATDGHELERYWDVGRRFVQQPSLPAPDRIDLQTDPACDERAAALLRSHGIEGNFVVICPFAGGRAATADKADKKWPAFAEFTQLACKRLGVPLVVYPGPGEDTQAREHYPGARLLAGADLAVYLSVLRRAALVVANDTGPAHMAAALGVRVVSVLGPTDAARWAPWGPGVTVLQKPRVAGAVVWPGADEALQLARELMAQPQ